MKFELPLTNACNKLNQAILDGFQVNQSLAAFIICRSLLQTLPGIQVVYDGRPCGETSAGPNLFIWQDGAVPILQFIGMLRFEPLDAVAGGKLNQTLEVFAAMPEASILDRNPMSFEYYGRQMKIAPNPELALLFVDDRVAKFRYWAVGEEKFDA